MLFYWKRRKEIPHDDEPWYAQNVVGHNVLDKMLVLMLSARVVNHSLLATAISRMMESNIPSKVIKERSGHLSKDSLVPCERTTAVQHQKSSRALVPIENMKEKSVKHSVKNTEESSEESSSTYQCEQSKEIGAEEKENVFPNDGHGF